MSKGPFNGDNWNDQMQLADVVRLVDGIGATAKDIAPELAKAVRVVLFEDKARGCDNHWEECACSPLDDLSPGLVTLLAHEVFSPLSMRTDRIGHDARTHLRRCVENLAQRERRERETRRKDR